MEDENYVNVLHYFKTSLGMVFLTVITACKKIINAYKVNTLTITIYF